MKTLDTRTRGAIDQNEVLGFQIAGVIVFLLGITAFLTGLRDN